MRSLHGIADDWPLTLGELEPHLCEAERLLGVAGNSDVDPYAAPRSAPFPQPGWPLSHADKIIRDGLASAGIHVTSTPQARNTQPHGGRPACTNLGVCNQCPTQARPGPTTTTLREALATGRVELVSEATVTRLETDANGRVVQAVWREPDGRVHLQDADLFVLAAHVPDSVRLLLHSTSRHAPNGIGNSEDMVGRCFMDHPRHNARGKLPERTWPNRVWFQTGAIHHWCDTEDRAARGAHIVELLNFIGSASPGAIASESDLWGQPLRDHIRESWGHDIQFHGIIEMLPDRANRITLDPDEVDVFGVPIAQFDVRFGDYDRAGMVSAAARMDEMFAILEATDTVHRPMRSGHLESLYHPSGGLRMGSDPETSVTDAWGRVHSTRNLFVAGTALFPTIGTSNPTLTMIALALRTAERINALGARGEI
jgi:choline dehydrogenase-like flavoprotein